jgi:hypothetical protein
MAHVLRILSAAALLGVVLAGCGGAAAPQRAAFHGVPPALAQAWEGQASAIAAAASAGNSCRALHLAASLRAAVARSQSKVPYRLRSPLLSGVNALADRITCTPVVTQPTAPKKAPKVPKPKPPPAKAPKPPHGHGKGHDK